jgi:hypothetical protein
MHNLYRFCFCNKYLEMDFTFIQGNVSKTLKCVTGSCSGWCNVFVLCHVCYTSPHPSLLEISRNKWSFILSSHDRGSGLVLKCTRMSMETRIGSDIKISKLELIPSEPVLVDNIVNWNLKGQFHDIWGLFNGYT